MSLATDDDAWDDDTGEFVADDDILVEVPDEYVQDVLDKEDEDDDTATETGTAGSPKSWKDIPLEPGEEHLRGTDQRRIKKARWQMHEKERLAQAALAEKEQYRTRAEHLEAELAQYRQHEAQSQIQDLDAQRKEKLREIREARDEFEDELADNLELELRELDAQAALAKAGKLAAPPPPPPPARQEPPAPPVATESLAQQWANAHPEMDNPAFAKQVNELFQKLQVEDGFNPEHPAIFRELDRRLKTAKPYSSATSPPARGHEGVQEGTGADGKGGFTAVHARSMRQAGKDPNDPKQRAAFMSVLKEFGGNIRRHG